MIESFVAKTTEDRGIVTRCGMTDENCSAFLRFGATIKRLK